MAVEDVIKTLEEERDKIDHVIRILKGGGGIPSPFKPAAAPKQGNRVMSAEARKKISEAAKRRWAKQKKGTK